MAVQPPLEGVGGGGGGSELADVPIGAGDPAGGLRLGQPAGKAHWGWACQKAVSSANAAVQSTPAAARAALFPRPPPTGLARLALSLLSKILVTTNVSHPSAMNLPCGLDG